MFSNSIVDCSESINQSINQSIVPSITQLTNLVKFLMREQTEALKCEIFPLVKNGSGSICFEINGGVEVDSVAKESLGVVGARFARVLLLVVSHQMAVLCPVTAEDFFAPTCLPIIQL